MARNFRRSILREMRAFNQKIGAGHIDFVRPDTLRCFRPGNNAFLAAVNELIGQGLLVQTDDPDHRLAVRLNFEKMDVINNEIESRAWYEDPRFIIPTLVAIVATAVAVAEFFAHTSR